jgi:photosystem II stability/assembly factor-like uncharacterized protein
MEGIFLGTRKGLFSVKRGSGGWQVASVSFLGVPVTALLPARDGATYAAVGHGHFGAKLHRSRDGGETWQEIAAPRWPEKPAGLDDRSPVSGKETPWSLEQIWILESAGDTLWCGTIPGGLFRSNDSGASWSLVRSLWDRPERRQWNGGGYDYPGIHSVCIDPRDDRRMLIGVSTGGVWVTEDGGESWALRGQGLRAEYMPPERQLDPLVQDTHRIVRCAAAPDALWAQHHNGIFRTTDGGRSWNEIKATPSSFGFAVAVHPRDPETAWFVPAIKDEFRVPVDAQLVVTRTRDGGKTFESLRKGLPQKHAYDLVYRHGLDVDETGDVLAMGSTTGSLWVSERQGESWSVISHHLPPIYCVRFG